MKSLKFGDFSYSAGSEHFTGDHRDTDSVKLMVLDAQANTFHCDVFSNLGLYLKDSDILATNKVGIGRSRLRGYSGQIPVDICFLLIEEPETEPNVWDAVVLSDAGAPPESGPITLADGQVAGFLLNKTQEFDGPYWIEKDKYRGHRGRVRIDVPPARLRQILDARGLFMHPWYTNLNLQSDARLNPYTKANYGVHVSEPARRITPRMYEEFWARGMRELPVSLSMSFSWRQTGPTIPLDNFSMNPEEFDVSREAVSILQRSVRDRRRLIAVGTSSARALESLPVPAAPTSGRTDIFIAPGYEFKYTSALLTNFHNPMGTHVVMAAAFGGHELVVRACEAAAQRNWQFGVHGDSMLILSNHTPAAWNT